MMTAMSCNGVRELLWKYWKRRKTMWQWKSNVIENAWERETLKHHRISWWGQSGIQTSMSKEHGLENLHHMANLAGNVGCRHVRQTPQKTDICCWHRHVANMSANMSAASCQHVLPRVPTWHDNYVGCWHAGTVSANVGIKTNLSTIF